MQNAKYIILKMPTSEIIDDTIQYNNKKTKKKHTVVAQKLAIFADFYVRKYYKQVTGNYITFTVL